MRKTSRLKAMIERPEILVMPGAYDPFSARMIELAGFEAIQCTGFGIAGSFLGLPDVSVIGMTEMADRTAAIARSVAIPVMADADTGFGNAVNVWFCVRTFEAAGAAGLNIEDQIMPKRCGHLAGKELVETGEMVGKIAAAVAAKSDPDFVVNARTDALAVMGVEETIRRGNAYLAAGATMVFVDGADSRDAIRRLAREINGPVAVNMVEDGKTPDGLSFRELEEMGVARVSLPGTAILGALRGMEVILAAVKDSGGLAADRSLHYPFRKAQSLVGMDEVYRLEAQFLSAEAMERKYSQTGSGR